jgi:hypothetical protein
MMNKLKIVLGGILFFISLSVFAEPYLAIKSGQRCSSCHVSPTGGGMRTHFGQEYGRSLAASDEQLSRISSALSEHFRIGGDFRAGAESVSVDGQEDQFNLETERASIYLHADLIPQTLDFYIDQQFSPASDNREAWISYKPDLPGIYGRAGQFFLPYGFRLQDDTAFIRQVTGINFSNADNGIELGADYKSWSVQLAVSNGTAGAAENNTDKQVSLRSVFIKPQWRAGFSINSNKGVTAKREMFNLFAGANLFSIQWLFEIDQIKDTAANSVTQQVLFAEINKEIIKGHNLKFTHEAHDPDTDVDEDERTRNSLVWEYFPLQQAQVRTGIRVKEGIPQLSQDNSDEIFVNLHAWF